MPFLFTDKSHKDSGHAPNIKLLSVGLEGHVIEVYI